MPSSLLLLPLLLNQSANPPLVVYKQIDTGRQFIGINNPEQITDADLGDANFGNTVIYREDLGPGLYRNWYSHVNKTNVTIGHGIQIVNISSVPVQIRRRARGFVGSILGGRCFSDMLADTTTPTTTTTIQPNGNLWLWRNDNCALPNSFFSGVIDFEVIGGTIRLDNLAYRSFSNLTGNRSYMGYITRTEPDGTRESRVYKGRTQFAQARLSLDFQINDASNGPLPIRSQDYRPQLTAFLDPVQRTFWFSNIGPAQNIQSSTRDMVVWSMPGWGDVDPLRRSDATGTFPNLGNWGITYEIQGSVTNNGTFTRNLSLNLQAPSNAGSPIAYRGNDNIWRSLRIEPSQNVQYYTFSVPPGQTVRFAGAYILGGPGGGSLRNTISVNNPVP